MLEQARNERQVLLGRQGSGQYAGAMVQTLILMLDRVQERIDHLEADLAEHTDTLVPDLDGKQVMAAWPRMSNELRKTLLGQVISRIDLAPGKAAPASRMTITVHPALVN